MIIMNELMLWLPSIIFDGSRDNSMNKTTDCDFYSALKGILDSLDKSSLYKLDYSLYLHTNDESKDVVYYLAPDSGKESVRKDMDSGEWSKAMVVLRFLYLHFKFHGYYVIHSDLIDFDIVKDYTLYTSEVHKSLCDSIPSVNKNPEVGFIEFRISVLLKITKNSKEYGDKSSKYTYSNIYDKHIKKYLKVNNSYMSLNNIAYSNIIYNSTLCKHYSTNVKELSSEDNYRNNVEKELLNSRMAISILSILN